MKFNVGKLFLIDEGFAFADRPATYLPFDAIADLRLERADGTSSTFDLVVTPEPEEGAKPDEPGVKAKPPAPLEFANIGRDELDGVRRWLAKRCDAAGGGEEGAH